MENPLWPTENFLHVPQITTAHTKIWSFSFSFYLWQQPAEGRSCWQQSICKLMRLQRLLQMVVSFDQSYWNDAFLYLFSKAQPVVLSGFFFKNKTNIKTTSKPNFSFCSEMWSWLSTHRYLLFLGFVSCPLTPCHSTLQATASAVPSNTPEPQPNSYNKSKSEQPDKIGCWLVCWPHCTPK